MNRFLQGWIEQLESQAKALAAQGDHRQAADIRLRLCQGIARHLGEEAPLLIDQMETLGACLRRAGALEEAESLYRRRLRLIRKSFGQRHTAFAHGLNQLGVLYCEMGRYRRAVGLYRRLLDNLENTEALDAPNRAALHHNQANACQALGQHHRAQRHYGAARALMQDLGPSLEHAQCLCDLAESLAYDRLGEAEALLKEATDEVRCVLSDHPADLARALIRIAGSYFRMRHVVKAEQLLQESISLLESAPREPGELSHCRSLLERVRREWLRDRSNAR